MFSWRIGQLNITNSQKLSSPDDRDSSRSEMRSTSTYFY